MADEYGDGHGAGDTTPWPARFEVTAQRDAHLRPTGIGVALIGVGSFFIAIPFCVGQLLHDSFLGPLASLPVIGDGIQPGGEFLIMSIFTVVGVLVLLTGVALLLDAKQLRRARLVIDHHGVSRQAGAAQEGATPAPIAPTRVSPVGLVTWERIRHIAILPGTRDQQRLLVDHGDVPVSWWGYSRRLRPGRALFRLLRHRRLFFVNLPVAGLDVPPSYLIDAIRHYSGGRFPNR